MTGIENGKFLVIGMSASSEEKKLEKHNVHEQSITKTLT